MYQQTRANSNKRALRGYLTILEETERGPGCLCESVCTGRQVGTVPFLSQSAELEDRGDGRQR